MAEYPCRIGGYASSSLSDEDAIEYVREGVRSVFVTPEHLAWVYMDAPEVIQQSPRFKQVMFQATNEASIVWQDRNGLMGGMVTPGPLVIED